MKRSLALISLCLLTGCSSNQSKEIDIDKTAETMISEYYNDEMIKANDDQIRSILMIDMAKNTCAVYVSSSNETNELSICKGEDEVLEKAFEERRDYNLTSAENYFPEEADKIKNSVIEKVGDAWVLITNDNSQDVLEAIKASLQCQRLSFNGFIGDFISLC